MSIPSVTVFMDEINTASCLGLFKEVIVDRSIDGVVREIANTLPVRCTLYLSCAVVVNTCNV